MATTDVTASTLEQTITDNDIVLVDFWAEWCGPCKRFGPVFEKASEEHPDATFAKLDTEANQDLAVKLQIQSIPTLMVFRDGILVFRQAGTMPPAALEDLISQVKDLNMDEVRAQVEEQKGGEA